jgi:hypothetical protein
MNNINDVEKVTVVGMGTNPIVSDLPKVELSSLYGSYKDDTQQRPITPNRNQRRKQQRLNNNRQRKLNKLMKKSQVIASEEVIFKA